MDPSKPAKPINLPAYLTVLASVAVLLVIPLFLKKDRERFIYEKALMGTLVEITIMEGEEGAFDMAAEAAFEEIRRLEDIFSSYKPDSAVSKISIQAGGEPVSVPPEVIYVMEEALKISKLSGGAFDPTVGALSRVWGFSGESGYVPGKEEVEAILPFVDYTKIALDKKAGTVGLEKEGMTLNLGGVAKGYIVGKAAAVLREKGVRRGIIKAGGDMFVFQEGIGTRPFIIGIKDPEDPSRLMGEVYVKNGAIATSGDYERFFIKDGVKFHHILDPKTGFPAHKSRSVTIVAQNPTLAG